MLGILAVRSDAVGSQVIRWGLREDASHLAIQVNESVFHSSVHGVAEVGLADFMDLYETVRGVAVKVTDRQADGIESELRALCGHVRYDYTALAYFAWRAALKRALDLPIPSRSLGDRRDAMLCVEALYGFFEAYAKIVGRTITLRDKAFGVMTPLECVAFAKETLGCDATAYTVFSSPSR